ncbi:hypothetical protein [Xanthomonas theicola]|uniref:hypothetical protein n=1 Tax=Xanthomonas theicola TaxID=56464 RepID=UPI00268AA6B3
MPEPRHRPASRLRVHGRRALRNAQRLLLSLLLVLFTVAAIAGSQKVLERDDARWLQSMAAGLDSASVSQLQRDGRSGFLRGQLQQASAGAGAATAQATGAAPAVHQGDARRRGQNRGEEGVAAARLWSFDRLPRLSSSRETGGSPSRAMCGLCQL